MRWLKNASRLERLEERFEQIITIFFNDKTTNATCFLQSFDAMKKKEGGGNDGKQRYKTTSEWKRGEEEREPDSQSARDREADTRRQ